MRRTLLLASMVAGLAVNGCAGAFVYYAPAPPPAVRVEVAGVAPGPGFVWINGYWGYRGGRYAWLPGRWAKPPRGRAFWTEGAWERHGNRWGYREGHWR